jgi:peptide/nickel transport system substrate-binding protein
MFREWSPAAQPSGFADVIVEHFGGSTDAHIAAVLHGSADLALESANASPAVLESVRAQHPSQLEGNPGDTTWFLVLNTRIAPFNDVRVRQALNFAIDREHLRDLPLGQGLGQLTCQVLPPNFDGYRRYCPYTASPSASGSWTASDLERARQLVRSSSSAGQTVTVWIAPWINIGSDADRYVVSVLDSLGYKARLRVPKFGPFAAEDKLHLQVGFYGWAPDFAAPASFIVTSLTCGVSFKIGNTAEFCDPAVDREIAHAQSLQTGDPEAASRLWAKVDRDLHPPGALGPLRKRRRARGRLGPIRQLRVQPPVGHAARPALGQVDVLR